MEIKITFIVKQPKKFLAKKETIDVIITNDDIIYYFDNIATPHDMCYICSHFNDDDLILTWIQKIAKYNNNSSELRYGEVLQVSVPDLDMTKVRNTIRLMADKRHIAISNTEERY